MKNIQKVMKKISGIAACSSLAILLTASLILPQVALAAVIADGDYLIQMADSDLAVVSSGMTVRERVTLGRTSRRASGALSTSATTTTKLLRPSWQWFWIHLKAKNTMEFPPSYFLGMAPKISDGRSLKKGNSTSLSIRKQASPLTLKAMCNA